MLPDIQLFLQLSWQEVPQSDAHASLQLSIHSPSQAPLVQLFPHKVELQYVLQSMEQVAPEHESMQVSSWHSVLQPLRQATDEQDI